MSSPITTRSSAKRSTRGGTRSESLSSPPPRNVSPRRTPRKTKKDVTKKDSPKSKTSTRTRLPVPREFGRSVSPPERSSPREKEAEPASSSASSSSSSSTPESPRRSKSASSAIRSPVKSTNDSKVSKVTKDPAPKPVVNQRREKSPPTPPFVDIADSVSETPSSQAESEFEGPKFPKILDVKIPPRYYQITDYLDLVTENDWFSIHAHAIECNAEDHSLGEFIHLECPKCKYSDSMTNVLGDKLSEYLKAVKGSKHGSILRVACSRCAKSSENDPSKSKNSSKSSSGPKVAMNFFFRTIFIIQSSCLSTLVVVLQGIAAAKVFGTTPQRVLVDENAAKDLFKVIDTICPESWEDKRRPESILNWVIKFTTFTPPDGSKTLLFHTVLTVTPVCASQEPASRIPEIDNKGIQCEMEDAAVGCNLSGRSVLQEKHFLFENSF